MPHDRSVCPEAGHVVPQQNEAARWSHRYRESVDWALRLREALAGCRGALQAAGIDYEPPAGWDVLLHLPEL